MLRSRSPWTRSWWHELARSVRHRRLITGWGHSPFGKLVDETLESLVVSVAREALDNAGIEPGQVDEIYLGQFNSGMHPLGFASSLALQVSDDLAGVPATRVENACGSGSAAVQQGIRRYWPAPPAPCW